MNFNFTGTDPNNFMDLSPETEMYLLGSQQTPILFNPSNNLSPTINNFYSQYLNVLLSFTLNTFSTTPEKDFYLFRKINTEQAYQLAQITIIGDVITTKINDNKVNKVGVVSVGSGKLFVFVYYTGAIQLPFTSDIVIFSSNVSCTLSNITSYSLQTSFNKFTAISPTKIILNTSCSGTNTNNILGMYNKNPLN